MGGVRLDFSCQRLTNYAKRGYQGVRNYDVQGSRGPESTCGRGQPALSSWVRNPSIKEDPVGAVV